MVWLVVGMSNGYCSDILITADLVLGCCCSGLNASFLPLSNFWCWLSLGHICTLFVWLVDLCVAISACVLLSFGFAAWCCYWTALAVTGWWCWYCGSVYSCMVWLMVRFICAWFGWLVAWLFEWFSMFCWLIWLYSLLDYMTIKVLGRGILRWNILKIESGGVTCLTYCWLV